MPTNHGKLPGNLAANQIRRGTILEHIQQKGAIESCQRYSESGERSSTIARDDKRQNSEDITAAIRTE